MGSLFETEFAAAAWGVLVSQHGETGTVQVTPIVTGVAVTVSAIFQRGRVLDYGGNSGGTDRNKPEAFGVLLLNPADVVSWTPARGDKVTIGSETFICVYMGKRAPILEIQISRTA